MLYNKADVVLAVLAINTGQIKSVRRAAATFNVPETTLRRRLNRTQSRHDCQPNLKILTKLEEEVVIEHILDLDSRGFSPSLDAVRDMANKLLAKRGAQLVGKKWLSNFVKRTERLTTRFNQPYD